jgi:hypothetical protein
VRAELKEVAPEIRARFVRNSDRFAASLNLLKETLIATLFLTVSYNIPRFQGHLARRVHLEEDESDFGFLYNLFDSPGRACSGLNAPSRPRVLFFSLSGPTAKSGLSK